MALWRLPRPDFHRLVDTDFQDTPLTLCPAARLGSTHCEFFLDTIQPYSFIAVAVITTEPAFRNRRRMKRMFCLILSFLTLPAYAQHLGIYQHGTVVRMRMGECLPAIIV